MNNLNFNIPTELCNIMGKYGSDKGSNDIKNSHHNYTILYYNLFKEKCYKKLSIFELGLGTNNINIKSNMGPNGKPGASLYGWREFFPNSNIYGADIDKDILFQSEKIFTYYCDQTDKNSIFQMWNSLENKFDIIIEDGLHTFEANVTFFENSIHKLNTDGYYIIEDIHINDKEKFNIKINEWKKKYIDLKFEFIEIPSFVNMSDNNILIVHKISKELIEYKSNSIIFCTAFQDINRKDWSIIPRTNEEYLKYFINLANNIIYKLIVYVDDNILEMLKKYEFKSNIIFHRLSDVKTFFNLYIENERMMINSEIYKNKIPNDRKGAPEHWCAEFNLVNHNKINYVSYTKKLYPSYEYYSWIDFGCIRNTIEDVPKNINFHKLNKKISYLCLKSPPVERINSENMLKSHDVYLTGSQFITHTSLVEKHEQLYKDLLENWKKEIICDDDQNAILQIYFNNKDLFDLYHSCEWFSLFRNHLNSNIEINNKNDIHKLINLCGFTGSYVEIGVARGHFTKYILNNTLLSKLILIDPYKNFKIEEFSCCMNSLDMDKEFEFCKDNLSNHKDKIKFIRKTSSDATIEIEDNSLDIVYIDGNHAYSYVLDDMKNYWTKIRSGGIMFGDDIYEYSENKDVIKIWDGQPIEHSKSWGKFGVHAALIDFCKEYKLNYYIFSNQFMIYKP